MFSGIYRVSRYGCQAGDSIVYTLGLTGASTRD